MVLFLDENGFQQNRHEMEVPSESIRRAADVFTTSTKVKFLIKTSANVDGIECTQACGEGEIVEII